MIEELQHQLGQIVENGILKTIEQPALRSKVLASLKFKRVLKLTLIGADIIVDLKIRNTPTQHKERFSKTYVKLFAQLPSPKDEIINYILFVVSYNIHWVLWKNPNLKELINFRFVYDCYHIIIFYSNGLYVSDSYIRGQIEKIFTAKFLEYERIQDQILLQKKLEQRRKQQEKTFLGRKLLFPSLSGEGVNFARNLTEKLKPPKLVRKDSVHVDTFDENDGQPSSQTKYLLSHLQLNVNQVSPSLKFVLHMNKGQVPFSRPKNLQHNFEKPDEKVKFIGLLSNTTEPQKQEKVRMQSNIIDAFNLRAPPKEYYQKFSKVDPLFKEMLDLNYVLNNHQESMYELYSTKELGKYEPLVIIDGHSDERKAHKAAQFELSLEEPAESNPPGNAPGNVQAHSLVSSLDLNKVETASQFQEFMSQQQQKQPNPLYKPKQKEYKSKYDKYVQSENVDNKINNIIFDLKKKTHLQVASHHPKSKRK